MHATEVFTVIVLLIFGKNGFVTDGFLLPTTIPRDNIIAAAHQQIKKEASTTTNNATPSRKRRQYFTSKQSMTQNNKRREEAHSKQSRNRGPSGGRHRRRQDNGVFGPKDMTNTRWGQIVAPDLFQLFDSTACGDVTTDENRTVALKRIRDHHTLGSIMNTWARAPRAPDAGDRCQNVIRHLRKHNDKIEHIRPRTFLYNVAINAYARRKQVLKAETLLRELVSLGPEAEEGPNSFTFSTVMNAWSKSNADDAPEQCKRLLDDMRNLANFTGSETLMPDHVTYNTVIDALASRGRAKEAEDMMKGMIANCATTPSLTPDSRTFHSVMRGWATSDADGGPEHCRRILSELEVFASSTGNKKLYPTERTYNIIIDAHASRGQAEKAENVLREMQQLPRIEADVFSFTGAINAWCKSDAEDAPEQCRRLLNELKSLSKSEGRPMQAPDTVVYTSVISAYGNRGRAREAEELLKEMVSDEVSPNVFTFNSVMDAWSKSDAKDAPEQCRRILNGMERTASTIRRRTGQRTELEPDCFSYNTLIDAYAVRGRAKEAEEVLRESLTRKNKVYADAVSFSMVMKAWGRSDAKDAPEQCVRLLSELQQLSGEQRGKKCLRPDESNYNTLRAVFSKYGRMQEAAKYIPKME